MGLETAPFINMLLNGNPQDEAKAKKWVIEQQRAHRRATIRDRVKIKMQDGKLYHGYSEDVSHNLKLCAARRELNSDKRMGEIAAVASFSKVAIRMFAHKIGVPTAEMYRNPELMKRMIKDSDYAKFRLNDRAAHMV